MKQKEFLDLLRYYLRQMPEPVIDDIILDYKEHFEIAKSMGKTEEEITAELGSAKAIADEYLKNESSSLLLGNKEQVHNDSAFDKIINFAKGNKLLSIFILIAILIGLPALFGIGLGFVGGLFGLLVGLITLIFVPFIVLFSIGISIMGAGAAIPISIVMPSTFKASNFISSLSPVTRIFAGIALICFGIILISIGVEFVKFILVQIKKLIFYIKWKLNRGKRYSK